MALKLKKGVKIPINVCYTLAEIMDHEFPELWRRSNEAFDRLKGIQGELLKLLPDAKESLPDSFEKLKIEQHKLLNYIRLRTLYSFAEMVAKKIDEQCRALANKENKNDRDGVEDATIALDKTLDMLSYLPLEKMVEDSVTGLSTLEDIKSRLERTMDWMVFKNWSFRELEPSMVMDSLMKTCGNLLLMIRFPQSQASENY